MSTTPMHVVLNLLVCRSVLQEGRDKERQLAASVPTKRLGESADAFRDGPGALRQQQQQQR